jgi:Pyruvate/2-oxoacid:ferredoxin oxidoreductase delta subunit
MPHGSLDIEKADHNYDAEKVPEKGFFYMPVQCQQCKNPPCVKVCPVHATWQEADGITVIDYDWCIGCRYCEAACPVLGAAFQLHQAIDSEREAESEHGLPRQSSAQTRSDGEMPLLHSTDACGQISGMPRSLSRRRAASSATFLDPNSEVLANPPHQARVHPAQGGNGNVTAVSSTTSTYEAGRSQLSVLSSGAAVASRSWATGATTRGWASSPSLFCSGINAYAKQFVPRTDRHRA